MQRDFVNDLVGLVRSALDEVDSSIPAGACTPGLERRYAASSAKRIAAEGQASVLRIDNAIYRHRTLTTFADMLAYTMAIANWNRGIPHLLDELETIRHRAPSYPKSVEVLESCGAWQDTVFNQIPRGIEVPVRLPCAHACILRVKGLDSSCVHLE